MPTSETLAGRHIVFLSWRDTRNPEILRYLNRLSDLLFTLARLATVRLLDWRGP